MVGDDDGVAVEGLGEPRLEPAAMLAVDGDRVRGAGAPMVLALNADQPVVVHPRLGEPDVQRWASAERPVGPERAAQEASPARDDLRLLREVRPFGLNLRLELVLAVEVAP